MTKTFSLFLKRSKMRTLIDNFFYNYKSNSVGIKPNKLTSSYNSYCKNNKSISNIKKTVSEKTAIDFENFSNGIMSSSKKISEIANVINGLYCQSATLSLSDKMIRKFNIIKVITIVSMLFASIAFVAALLITKSITQCQIIFLFWFLCSLSLYIIAKLIISDWKK